MKNGKVSFENERAIREYFSQFNDPSSVVSQMLVQLRESSAREKQEKPKEWEKTYGRKGAEDDAKVIRNLPPPALRRAKELQLPDGRRVSMDEVYSAFADFLFENPDIKHKSQIPFILSMMKSSFFKKFKPKFEWDDFNFVVFHDFLKEKYGIDEATLREWFFTP